MLRSIPFFSTEFCAREFSLNFSASHNGGIETKENFYEYKNNFDYRFGWSAWRGCDVGFTASFTGCGCERPESSLLHLSDAPIGQVGQTRQLSRVRDELATSLCGLNRHKRRAIIVIGLLLVLTKENL